MAAIVEQEQQMETSLEGLVTSLGGQLETLSTQHTLLNVHTNIFTQTISELQQTLDPAYPPYILQELIEKANQLRDVSENNVKVCTDYFSTAKTHEAVCKTLASEELHKSTQESCNVVQSETSTDSQATSRSLPELKHEPSPDDENQSEKKQTPGSSADEFTYGVITTGRFLEMQQLLGVLRNQPLSLCQGIPEGLKENCYFLIDNADNMTRRKNKQKSTFKDDCGSWSYGASNPSYWILGKDDVPSEIYLRDGEYCTVSSAREVRPGARKVTRVFTPIAPQPKTVFEIHRFYAKHKLSPGYNRRISWIENTSLDLPQVAVVEYLGKFPKGAADPKANEDDLQSATAVLSDDDTELDPSSEFLCDDDLSSGGPPEAMDYSDDDYNGDDSHLAWESSPTTRAKAQLKDLNVVTPGDLTKSEHSPFSCNTCGKSYKQQRSLTKHKNTVHPDEMVDDDTPALIAALQDQTNDVWSSPQNIVTIPAEDIQSAYQIDNGFSLLDGSDVSDSVTVVSEAHQEDSTVCILLVNSTEDLVSASPTLVPKEKERNKMSTGTGGVENHIWTDQPHMNSGIPAEGNLRHVEKYRCDICLTTFSSSSSLSRHKKRIHGNKIGNEILPVIQIEITGKDKVQVVKEIDKEKPDNMMVNGNLPKQETETKEGITLVVKGTAVEVSSNNLGKRRLPKLNKEAEKDKSEAFSEIDCKKPKQKESKVEAECMICLESFDSVYHRNIHMTKHDKPYPCRFCGKTYLYTQNLKYHLRTHTGEKPYQCDLCAWAFHKKAYLKKHRLRHMKKQAKQYINEGGETDDHAVDQDKKAEKLEVKHPDLPLETPASSCDKIIDWTSYGSKKCPVCSQVFRRDTSLDAHFSNVHGYKDVQAHQCSQCEVSYRHKFNLTRHINLSHAEVVQCPICSASLKGKCNLQTHMKKHSCEMKDICHLCGKTFLSPNELMIHIEAHSETLNSKKKKVPTATLR